MAEKVEKSVGLVVLTEIPEMGLVAVLQERGRFNTGKMKPESWPGGCQVTAHGKVRKGEKCVQALLREVGEELGRTASQFIRNCINDLVVVSHFQKTDKEVVTYAVKLEPSFLKRIRLGSDSGGLRYVQQKDINNTICLDSSNRTAGILYRPTIGMFPDEKEALIKAFACFS